jgi:hypothetical protein
MWMVLACSCFHYCPNVFEGLKVPSLPPLAYKRIDAPTCLRSTGISRTGWHPAFVPAAVECGTDGSLHRTRRPSRTHCSYTLSIHCYSNADPQRSTRPDPTRLDLTPPPHSPTLRSRRPLNSHQTRRRARRALDPPRPWLRPLHREGSLGPSG